MSTLELNKLLLDSKWRTISIDEKNFLFKFVKDEVSYEVLLFDSEEFELFHLKHEDEDIQRLFKRLNPSMEAPSSKIVANVESNLVHSKTSAEHFNLGPRLERDRLKIKMESKLVGVRIAWEMSFELLNAKLIRDYVLMPLVFACAEYQTRERELLKTILTKDKEIDDYTSQGCKLSRQFLATKPFNVDSFDKEMSKANESESQQVINNPLSSLSTTYADKINQICFNKYVKSYYKLSDQVEASKGENVTVPPSRLECLTQSESDVQSQEPERSQRVSQRDERLKILDMKLKEEPKKATPKKKKLF